MIFFDESTVTIKYTVSYFWQSSGKVGYQFVSHAVVFDVLPNFAIVMNITSANYSIYMQNQEKPEQKESTAALYQKMKLR